MNWTKLLNIILYLFIVLSFFILLSHPQGLDFCPDPGKISLKDIYLQYKLELMIIMPFFLLRLLRSIALYLRCKLDDMINYRDYFQTQRFLNSLQGTPKISWAQEFCFHLYAFYFHLCLSAPIEIFVAWMSKLCIPFRELYMNFLLRCVELFKTFLRNFPSIYLIHLKYFKIFNEEHPKWIIEDLFECLYLIPSILFPWSMLGELYFYGHLHYSLFTLPFLIIPLSMKIFYFYWQLTISYEKFALHNNIGEYSFDNERIGSRFQTPQPLTEDQEIFMDVCGYEYVVYIAMFQSEIEIFKTNIFRYDSWISLGYLSILLYVLVQGSAQEWDYDYPMVLQSNTGMGLGLIFLLLGLLKYLHSLELNFDVRRIWFIVKDKFTLKNIAIYVTFLSGLSIFCFFFYRRIFRSIPFWYLDHYYEQRFLFLVLLTLIFFLALFLVSAQIWNQVIRANIQRKIRKGVPFERAPYIHRWEYVRDYIITAFIWQIGRPLQRMVEKFKKILDLMGQAYRIFYQYLHDEKFYTYDHLNTVFAHLRLWIINSNIQRFFILCLILNSLPPIITSTTLFVEVFFLGSIHYFYYALFLLSISVTFKIIKFIFKVWTEDFMERIYPSLKVEEPFPNIPDLSEEYKIFETTWEYYNKFPRFLIYGLYFSSWFQVLIQGYKGGLEPDLSLLWYIYEYIEMIIIMPNPDIFFF